MQRAITLLATVGTVVALTAGPAMADVPPPVNPHQHFIITPSGELNELGPEVCANQGDRTSDLQGFYGFHAHVHLGVPGQQVFTSAINPDGPSPVIGQVRPCTFIPPA
jgi:hypothetical protein